MNRRLAVAPVRCREMGDSKVEPHMCRHVVGRYTVSYGVEHAKVILSLRVSLIGGQSIPFCRFGMVLRRTLTRGIHDPKLKLGSGVALFGGAAKPSKGLSVVARHGEATLINLPNQGLGAGIALLDRVCAQAVDTRGMTLRPLEPERWILFGYIYQARQELSRNAAAFLVCMREVLERFRDLDAENARAVVPLWDNAGGG